MVAVGQTPTGGQGAKLSSQPLNGATFASLVAAWKMPVEGVDFVKRAMSGYLSRRVTSSGSNVVASIPSLKNGSRVDAESRTLELAYFRLLEHDPEVLAYFEQPGKLKVDWVLKGVPSGTVEYPDVLVITREGATLVNIKALRLLKKLVVEKPHRWQGDETTGFRNVAAEAAAAKLGMRYRVVSTQDINPVLLRNLIFLDDYFFAADDLYPADYVSHVVQAVKDRPGLSIVQLEEISKSLPVIHWLIAKSRLFVNLGTASLLVPGECAVFPDLVSAMGYVRPPHALDEICGRDVGVLDAEKSLEISRWRDVSPAEQLRALRRLRAVEDRAGAGKLSASPRSIRRWANRLRTSEISGASPLSVLCRRRNTCTKPEMTESERLVDNAVQEAIKGGRLRQDPLSLRETYGLFQAKIEALKLEEKRSFGWFYKEYRKVTSYVEVLATSGARAAYAYKPMAVGEDPWVHGDYPWHIVHIDHTQLDEEIVDSVSGKNLGRPWLTIAIDAFSRRILAFYLTFDKPSVDSVAGCLRWMVLLHGRLPNTLVIDNGAEFKSNWFLDLMMVYRVNVQFRPPAKARFGAICERMFRTTNQRLIHLLRGNTRLMKDPRIVMKMFNPADRACWTMVNLFELLAVFFYELYDQTIHEGLSVSPRQIYDHAVQKEDRSALRPVSYEDEFYFLSLPYPSRPTVKVTPGKGIRINGLHYTCSAMFVGDVAGMVENKKVVVRYDPSNLGWIYAYFGGRWHLCRCTNPIFNWRGGIHRISESLVFGSKRRAAKGGGRLLSFAELREAVTNVEGELQRRRDEESRMIAPFQPLLKDFYPGGRVAEIMARVHTESVERVAVVKKYQAADAAESATASGSTTTVRPKGSKPDQDQVTKEGVEAGSKSPMPPAPAPVTEPVTKQPESNWEIDPSQGLSGFLKSIQSNFGATSGASKKDTNNEQN